MGPGGASAATVAFGPGQLVPAYDPASVTTGNGVPVKRGFDGHQRGNRVAWIVAGLAVSAAALVLIAGVALVSGRRGSTGSDDVPITLPSAPASVAAVDSAATAPSFATSATSSGQPSPQPAALGTVSVTSSGAPCAVQVAGKWLGQTPVQSSEVPVGEHTMTCTPSKGTALVKTVRVRAGETTKVLFVASAQPPPSKKDPMDSWK